jgi:hypothetical protein
MRRPYFICLTTLLSAAAISSATAQAPHAPEPPDPSAGLLPAQPIPLTDLGAFRPTAANWRVAGGAAADRGQSLALQAEPGTGVLVNIRPTRRRGTSSPRCSTATSTSRSTSCCRRLELRRVPDGPLRGPAVRQLGRGVADVRRHGRDLPAVGREARGRATRATRDGAAAQREPRARALAAPRHRVPRAAVRGQAQDRERAVHERSC